jgi:hypothetical protein
MGKEICLGWIANHSSETVLVSRNMMFTASRWIRYFAGFQHFGELYIYTLFLSLAPAIIQFLEHKDANLKKHVFKITATL